MSCLELEVLPLPNTYPVRLFIGTLSPYEIWASCKSTRACVLRAALAGQWAPRRALGSLACSQLVRSTGKNLGLLLASEGGTQGLSLTLWDAAVQADRVSTEGA